MAYETFWEPQGIRWVFSGTVTDEDLIRSNEELYEDPRFPEIRYEIADFRSVEGILENASSETVRRVARMDMAQSSRNPDLKVAILATTLLIKGFARMYALFGDESRWEIRIFETEEDARRWFAA
jgi:hypothetical protein